MKNAKIVRKTKNIRTMDTKNKVEGDVKEDDMKTKNIWDIKKDVRMRMAMK